MPSTNVYNELCIKICLLGSSPKKLLLCNAVYFRLCIDLMHITPPLTADGYDGSHHPRYAQFLCEKRELDSSTKSSQQSQLALFAQADLVGYFFAISKHLKGPVYFLTRSDGLQNGFIRFLIIR